jgi:hypothetical protein
MRSQNTTDLLSQLANLNARQLRRLLVEHLTLKPTIPNLRHIF